MAAAIKMDELLVSWLGSDAVFQDVQKLVESYRAATDPPQPTPRRAKPDEDDATTSSPRGVIPPFYPKDGRPRRRTRFKEAPTYETWFPKQNDKQCVRDQVRSLFDELVPDTKAFSIETFPRVTKEVWNFPSFCSRPLFIRILQLWNTKNGKNENRINISIMEWYWANEMEPYDTTERFFRLLKQPKNSFIERDDFLPYIKELLNDHPVSSQVLVSPFRGHVLIMEHRI
jgi:hypothetical protein